VATTQMGADVPVVLRAGVCTVVVTLTVAAAQTDADAPAARSTEITTFTGSAALPPRTGTIVTMGYMPLSGMSILAAAGQPSPGPTMSSGPR
jgi:hypothetical protein